MFKRRIIWLMCEAQGNFVLYVCILPTPCTTCVVQIINFIDVWKKSGFTFLDKLSDLYGIKIAWNHFLFDRWKGLSTFLCQMVRLRSWFRFAAPGKHIRAEGALTDCRSISRYFYSLVPFVEDQVISVTEYLAREIILLLFWLDIE